MRKSRGIAIVLGAITALLTGGLVNAGTANADLGDCPSTYACFWVDTYYRGTMGKVAGDNRDFQDLHNSSGCRAYPGTWNDCVSSVANRGTRCTVFFYVDAGYKGHGHSLSRGDQVPDFGAAAPIGYSDPGFNDKISSNKWCS